jgi:hypothetical protein
MAAVVKGRAFRCPSPLVFPEVAPSLWASSDQAHRGRFAGNAYQREQGITPSIG